MLRNVLAVLFIIVFAGKIEAQPLSFGLSYGNNFTHAYPLMEVVTSDEINSSATASNQYGFLLRYKFSSSSDNWLGLETRLIERRTSYHYYMMAGGYLMDGNYYLKAWEILLSYSQHIFYIKNRLSFNLHFFGGFSNPVDYRFVVYNPSSGVYENVEPRHKKGIVAGYGFNVLYPVFNRRLSLFVKGSLSYVNIKYLYSVECEVGVLYNFKFRHDLPGDEL